MGLLVRVQVFRQQYGLHHQCIDEVVSTFSSPLDRCFIIWFFAVANSSPFSWSSRLWFNPSQPNQVSTIKWPQHDNFFVFVKRFVQVNTETRPLFLCFAIWANSWLPVLPPSLQSFRSLDCAPFTLVATDLSDGPVTGIWCSLTVAWLFLLKKAPFHF